MNITPVAYGNSNNQHVQNILIDTSLFSMAAELGDNVIKYVQETWPDGIVKVMRTTERSGLIRAKLTGATAATGDVLVFLDAHCEVNERW